MEDTRFKRCRETFEELYQGTCYYTYTIESALCFLLKLQDGQFLLTCTDMSYVHRYFNNLETAQDYLKTKYPWMWRRLIYVKP